MPHRHGASFCGRICHHLPSKLLVTITVCGPTVPTRASQKHCHFTVPPLLPSHLTASAPSSASTVYQVDCRLLSGPRGHQGVLSTAFLISPGTAQLLARFAPSIPSHSSSRPRHPPAHALSLPPYQPSSQGHPSCPS